MSEKIALCWLRRDLRLHDQAALFHALKSGYRVLSIFVFDTEILSKLPSRSDARVAFIHATLQQLQQQLQALGSGVWVFHGKVEMAFEAVLKQFSVAEVYANHDYELTAIQRDDRVRKQLNAQGIPFYTFKDQTIFEKDEVLSATGKPYTVFSPYMRAWRQQYNDFHGQPYPTESYFHRFYAVETPPLPTLEEMGFEAVQQDFPPNEISVEVLERYAKLRNFPARNGNSRLSVHLRFGTISIRQLMRLAMQHSATFVNELIWRDFYMSILWHFPHINEGKAFKPAYDHIIWRNDEAEFRRWCEGTTGFPLVDAGMRELNATGFMHNRVRMVTASFLIKDLLIDWRWGEAYFAEKLLDYDFSANNGGWQWASGSGCDAAPYFRVFNPTLQAQKFDPKAEYIRRWIPEFDTPHYPAPMLDHAAARLRALAAYNAALKP